MIRKPNNSSCNVIAHVFYDRKIPRLKIHHENTIRKMTGYLQKAPKMENDALTFCAD